MDQQFALLVPGDVPRAINGISLGIVDGGNFAVSLTAHGPTIVMPHDMLVLTHENSPPFYALVNNAYDTVNAHLIVKWNVHGVR